MEATEKKILLEQLRELTVIVDLQEKEIEELKKSAADVEEEKERLQKKKREIEQDQKLIDRMFKYGKGNCVVGGTGNGRGDRCTGCHGKGC